MGKTAKIVGEIKERECVIIIINSIRGPRQFSRLNNTASVGIGSDCVSAIKDLNATALVLRVLRLCRYDVSAGN